jgi:hypothetical protein
MKSSFHSTNNSQFQSITSKSSSSSITSILRDSSPNRPKKKNNVRFEDSPTVSVYSEASPADVRSSASPSSQTASKSPSPAKPCTAFRSTLEKKPSSPSPLKRSPVKLLPSPESRNDSEEKKNTPKVINYSFRNQGFYDKLNRFYSKDSKDSKDSAPKEPERIFIKLNPQAFESPEVKVIHLRPCSSQNCRNKSREGKKRLRGANILN